MIDPKNIIKNLPENEAQEYADLWDYKNDKIKLNNNIREYIDEM